MFLIYLNLKKSGPLGPDFPVLSIRYTRVLPRWLDHRLVAETFLADQRSEDKPMVLHKDDVKTNNTVENLY